MNIIEEAVATLGIPGSIAVVMVIIFTILQLIGEFIEAFGKVAPTALKIRKILKARRLEKREQQETLVKVKTLLESVNAHYSADNISKRDKWMSWVNSRADVYDNTIIEYKNAIDTLTNALNANTKMTEQMFIETSRDRIIDFASKVSNHPLCNVSREEFNRIFKIYQKYEDFLEAHNMTNGEVELNYQLIKEAYIHRQEHHTFVEDMRERNLSEK